MPSSFKFNDQQITYIHTHCKTRTCNEIARDLRIDRGVLGRYMDEQGIRMSRTEACRLRGVRRIGFTTYSPAEDDYIRSHYLDTPIKRIAKDLGRSNCGVMGRLRAMGLELPTGVALHNMMESRFQKGRESHNKGKSMTPQMRERMQHTFYKPGNLPANTRKNGDISIRADKRGVKYKFIRIGLSRWEALARYNYRMEHGPIPHGHVIIHLDGDTLNCEPYNLGMITKAQNMLRNTIHQYPQEIKDTIHTLSTLNRKIRHAEKQN